MLLLVPSLVLSKYCGERIRVRLKYTPFVQCVSYVCPFLSQLSAIPHKYAPNSLLFSSNLPLSLFHLRLQAGYYRKSGLGGSRKIPWTQTPSALEWDIRAEVACVFKREKTYLYHDYVIMKNSVLRSLWGPDSEQTLMYVCHTNICPGAGTQQCRSQSYYVEYLPTELWVKSAIFSNLQPIAQRSKSDHGIQKWRIPSYS